MTQRKKKSQIPVKKLDYLPLMIPAKKRKLFWQVWESKAWHPPYGTKIMLVEKHWSEHQAQTKTTARDINRKDRTQLRRTENVSRSSQFYSSKAFCFASHWLKNRREILKPIIKRSNCNRVKTFESHLKWHVIVCVREILDSNYKWLDSFIKVDSVFIGLWAFCFVFQSNLPPRV